MHHVARNVHFIKTTVVVIYSSSLNISFVAKIMRSFGSTMNNLDEHVCVGP